VIELIDTHCHLQEPEFAEDLDSVVLRARDAGVVQMIVPAIDLETSQSALELSRRYKGTYATAGYHPHDASKLTDESLTRIDALLDDENVVAVGEIGLDFFRMHSSVEEQERALASMLDLAERHMLPIVVHCRDAWDSLAPIVEPWASRVAPGFGRRPLGVLHYFTSDLETAQRYVALGFLVSMHTSVTHPKASQLREVASALPLESLVIETDSPYGAPQAFRGKRNEPAYVLESAKQVAQVRGLTIEEVAEATTANARRLFRLPALVNSPATAGAKS
jgi:TatD DNase family protein